MEECSCKKHKKIPRDSNEIRLLQNRIKRMIGQLEGISGMIDDNRYCGDILIQISALEGALRNFGYAVLGEHMESCVVAEIREGNDDIIPETLELIKKLR